MIFSFKNYINKRHLKPLLFSDFLVKPRVIKVIPKLITCYSLRVRVLFVELYNSCGSILGISVSL
jgi:hypothetical protein